MNFCRFLLIFCLGEYLVTKLVPIYHFDARKLAEIFNFSFGLEVKKY